MLNRSYRTAYRIAAQLSSPKSHHSAFSLLIDLQKAIEQLRPNYEPAGLFAGDMGGQESARYNPGACRRGRFRPSRGRLPSVHGRSFGGGGRCIVDYIPHEAPRLEYVEEMQEQLPARMADTAVQAAFAGLGSLEEQAEPFREFARSLLVPA